MRILFFTSLCLMSLSCNLDNELNNLDLKMFFWDINSYESPIVLQYDIDSLGTKSWSYFLFEKLNETDLSIKRFDKSFNEVQHIIDRYTDNGVLLYKSFFHENQHSKLTTERIIAGSLIFSFNNSNTELFINSSFQSTSDKNIMVFDKNTWKLGSVNEKRFDNRDVITIISTGENKRTIKEISTGETQTFLLNYEIWYSEGIGITMFHQKFPYGSIKEVYSKTITYDEFNGIRNSDGQDL